MPTALDAYNQVERTGCRVFPIPYGSKKPNIPNWRDAASADPLRVGEMFYGDNYNIGCVVPDNLFLYDADERTTPGAITNTRELLRNEGFDPDKLLHFVTASGGEHFPFHTPYPIATKIRPFGKDVGIDIIGFGSQFIGAPSVVVYPDGLTGTYKVVNDGATIPMATPNMLAQLVKYEERKQRVETGDIQELDNVADVIGFKAVIAGTPAAIEGQGGNDRTYKLACEGRDSGLSEDTVLRCILMSDWNQKQCAPPWQFVELSELVANAFRYGRSSQGSKSVASLFQGVVPPPPVAVNGHSLPAGLVAPPFNPTGAPAPYEALPDDWIAPPSQDVSDRPWVVHDLLCRQQVTAMAAHGGTGKGMMLAALATRLVTGGTFGPWLFGGGARVVILSYEEDAQMVGNKIQGQLEHFNLNKNAIFDNIAVVNRHASKKIRLTRTTRGDTFVDEAAVTDLTSRLKRYGADVMFIDPLQFIGSGDMNLSHVAASLMEALWAVTIEANISLCFMHHVAKGDKNVGLRGSSTLSNNTRLVHSLERNDEYEGHNVVDVSMNKTNLCDLDKKHYFFEIIKYQLTPRLSTGVMIDSAFVSQTVSKSKQELRDMVSTMLASGANCEDGKLPQGVIREWLMVERNITADRANKIISENFKTGIAVRMNDGNYITRKKKDGSTAYVFVYSDSAELSADALRYNRPLPRDDDDDGGNIEDLF